MYTLLREELFFPSESWWWRFNGPSYYGEARSLPGPARAADDVVVRREAAEAAQDGQLEVRARPRHLHVPARVLEPAWDVPGGHAEAVAHSHRSSA